jgi:hypothetical protein
LLEFKECLLRKRHSKGRLKLKSLFMYMLIMFIYGGFEV